jgi:hypothetical protein
MTVRAAQVLDFDGELPVTFTPTVADSVSINDCPCIVEINNGSGGSINYTLVDGGRTPAGTAGAALTPVAIAAGAKRRFKLTSQYAGSNGEVAFQLSSVTSVTAEVYKI